MTDSELLQLMAQLKPDLSFGEAFPSNPSGVSVTVSLYGGGGFKRCTVSCVNTSPLYPLLNCELAFAEYMQREERKEDRWYSSERVAIEQGILRLMKELK